MERCLPPRILRASRFAPTVACVWLAGGFDTLAAAPFLDIRPYETFDEDAADPIDQTETFERLPMLALAAPTDEDLGESASRPAGSASGSENQTEGGEGSSSDLAKKSQNPISDLISVPIESAANYGVGLDDSVQFVLTIKPVYPQKLNDDWNWIHRAIIPFIYQPDMGDVNLGRFRPLSFARKPIRSALRGAGLRKLSDRVSDPLDQAAGLGDIQYQGYLSVARPGPFGLIWGVGPVIQFPTATDKYLGARQWCLGPGGVVLRMDGPWVYGALINNIWSLGGPGDKDVNLMTLQPFVNYNLPKGWYLTSAPIITSNWEADGGDRWTVPVGGGIGRVFKLGKLPVSLSFTTFYNIEKPDGAPDWYTKLQLSFLFPK